MYIYSFKFRIYKKIFVNLMENDLWYLKIKLQLHNRKLMKFHEKLRYDLKSCNMKHKKNDNFIYKNKVASILF